MTQSESKFELIKQRYIDAYKKVNGRKVISLTFRNGWCYLTTPTFGFYNKTTIRVSDLERMTETLELRIQK